MDDPSERHLAPSLSERKTETATAIDDVGRVIVANARVRGGILDCGSHYARVKEALSPTKRRCEISLARVVDRRPPKKTISFA
jgi:hypothetical protein